MTESTYSYKEILFDDMKKNLSNLKNWSRVETQLAKRLIELPDTVTKETNEDIITGLQSILSFLTEQGYTDDNCNFLHEEIDRMKHTVQLGEFRSKESRIPPGIAERYAKSASETEGVISIHLPFNYEQCKNLTEQVYRKTNLVKFFISKEISVYGKITAEVYQHAQLIPVATLVEKITNDDIAPRHIVFFGETVAKRQYTVIKEISQMFFVYKFVTEYGEEYMMLSTEKLVMGDFVVSGVVTHCTDLKQLTDSARLPTKLPFFFVQEAKSRIIKYKDHFDFKNKTEHLEIRKTTLFEVPFTIKSPNGRHYLTKVHEWYKWFIWAWMLHTKRGDMFKPYPMHIMVVGPKGSGKSTQLNVLHSRTKEHRDIFSGSSSTLKSLIPSFKTSPVKVGYLIESNRFAFCDEFLRCLVSLSPSKEEKGTRDESAAMMNDLLEHQKREVGSGNASTTVNMTARVYATTNPVRDTKTMPDLLKVMEPSFLSRWLIYYQKEEDVKLVREATSNQLRIITYRIEDSDLIGIIDYMQSFEADLGDMQPMWKTYYDQKALLSEDLLDHYEARHRHHIECLLDGLVKARCLFEGDSRFHVIDEDYRRLDEIWTNIISSWIDVKAVQKLEVGRRIKYMPEACQYIYKKIYEYGGPIHREELRELCKDEIDTYHFMNYLIILVTQEIVHEADEGKVKLHFMGSNWKNRTQEQIAKDDEELMFWKRKDK